VSYIHQGADHVGHIAGEIRESSDGRLYEWVESVDGLGNPIGFWKTIKRAAKAIGKGVTQAAQFAVQQPVLAPVAQALRSIPYYGNYCGPGTRCGQNNCGRPVDRMDECCRQHDECYFNFLRLQLPRNRVAAMRCDYPACVCWLRVVPTNPKAAIARETAIQLFCPPPMGTNKPGGAFLPF